MSRDAIRNVAIILVLAAAVFALSSARTAAAVAGELLFIVFAVGVAFLLARFYRENRLTLFGLGDRGRLLLYGALGGIVFLAAAAERFFTTGPGTLLWLVGLAGAGYALYAVWRQHKAYG